MLRIFSKRLHLQFALKLLLVACIVSSCKKGDPVITLPLSGPDQGFYALADNSLLRFNANNIKTPISKVTITGLSAVTEKLLSIDFRPATGELYGVSDASKLYIIDVITGKTRTISTTAFTPLLAGTIASLDFNPTVDRIRIVTNTGQNLVLNPETGVVTSTDTNVGSTAINGIAYSNSIAGATSTTLYDIDAAAKVLYKQDPPSNGTLVKVGNLELDLGTNVSFDISPDNKNAIAIGRSSTGANLYTINLSTGLTELRGRFPADLAIQGIAILSNPVAYAVDNTNTLLIFNPLSTGSATKNITGLQNGETILGLDMRPENGQLYALGSTNRLYTVNIGTGAFTEVGILTTALSGTSFGFDFDPIADLIRVVSNTGQNLRINPANASVTVDVNITTVTAALSAAAYSNNFKGATATKLFVIDHTVDKLYTQEPNSGVLTAIGDLKVSIENTNGFDIISTTTSNTAYGIFTVAGKNGLYRIDLGTGSASAQGDITNIITAFTLGLRF
ncbi:DUF4394 domain-containing protein [Pedobacter polaris]|uniref:DUF4394 domain-containing protein n=1 Tax=Pedobacter polaris TaxID=2571273 RepID=A0A4U1CY70_9SPHI|nr:DUF4394 domain-containing protein [Pedobacter polaris]TKC12539.1 DUF4394 domain-containing protein [Pedobacter polaris]